MFSIFGYEQVLESIYHASDKNFLKNKQVDTQELKTAHLIKLETMCPSLFVNKSHDLIVSNAKETSRLKRLFRPSVLDDLDQSEMLGDCIEGKKLEKNITRLRKALEVIEVCNPQYYRIFCLIVHSLFFSEGVKNHLGETAKGGTTSAALGVIWMTDISNRKIIDIVETLIHELTHLTLFVDELTKEQFNNESLIQDVNTATSVIFKKKRPIDKVVHSIVVGTEVLLFRETHLRGILDERPNSHPESEILAQSIAASANEVLANNLRSKVLTFHGEEIVRRSAEAIEHFILKRSLAS